jgi:hypothetical protein
MGLETSGTGQRLQKVAELRKSNFEGAQSQFCNCFLVRNSAIDLVVSNIAELRRCGLKLRMPRFGNIYILGCLTSGNVYILSCLASCNIYTLRGRGLRHRELLFS